MKLFLKEVFASEEQKVGSKKQKTKSDGSRPQKVDMDYKRFPVCPSGFGSNFSTLPHQSSAHQYLDVFCQRDRTSFESAVLLFFCQNS